LPEKVGVVLPGVQDTKDNYVIDLDPVKDFVWKARGEQTVKTTIIHRRTLRVMFEALN